jgi:hypothetical protein
MSSPWVAANSGKGRILMLAERDPGVHLIENPGSIVSTELNGAIRQAWDVIIISTDVYTEYAVVV